MWRVHTEIVECYGLEASDLPLDGVVIDRDRDGRE